MPTYLYAVVMPDGSDGEHFEVFQRMSEPALAHHPESGLPVRRVPVPPQFTTNSDSQRFGDSNLKRLGFAKFEKDGDGRYRRTAGSGPDTIGAD
ncbi:MAG: zinc ribbon domain-containing protein [Phycisphaerae bacterium]|nr:zinc ribbon domain-containing protein [Phycisphaerae bacterium]